MSDVVVSVTESVTDVAVTETSVDVNVTETTVSVVTGTAGAQGASYEPGDPIYVTVRNATGSTMAKGTIVYTSGANGTHTQVSPALATSDATSARVLGWLAEDIANNASGLCQVEGYLDGINTQGITAGAQLYLSGTTAGGFQTAKPQAPIHLVYVGVVAKVSAGNGRVFVKCQNGYELGELHDTVITDPANNQVLTYESSTGLWKNKDNVADGVTSVVFSAPLTGGTITSSGTVGLDQTALTVAQSQVTNLTTDLAGKAALTASQTFTGLQTLQASATGTVALIAKAFSAGSTANPFEVQTSAGTGIFRVSPLGYAIVGTSSALGMLSVQPQSASLAGAVVRGAASQSANLQEWQNSAGVIQSYINSAGTFLVNGGSYIENTGRVFINSSSAAYIPLTVRGTTSQTGNLQEWQNSAGTTKAFINASGDIQVPSAVATYAMTVTAGGAAVRPMLVKGAASQTANLQEWQDSAGSVNALIASTGSIRTTGHIQAGTNTYVDGQMYSAPTNASTKGLVVRGAVSQSANLQEWQDSAGTVVGSISAAGAVNFAARLLVTCQNSGSTALYLQGANSSQVADLAIYRTSASVVLGGRNANAQIYTGSTAPLTTAVGGATTAASGTGTTATLTTTSNHNLAVGDRITVAGVTPTAYNGTFIVTAAATNSVSYASTATGAQTVAGTVSVDAQASITARSAATAGLLIRGASGASSNLQEWQNSAGSVLAYLRYDGVFRAPFLATINNHWFAGEQNSGGYMNFNKATAAGTNPGAARAILYFRDGTNAGTLKLVVRAGAAGAETTILDNIPQ